MIPYGYVYRIRNKINGKTYVGQRKLTRDKGWRHYMGSGVLIKAAIEKYGKENFVKEFISYAEDSQQLNDLEFDHILLERNKGFSQYNINIAAAPPISRMTENQQKDSIEMAKITYKANYRVRFEDFVSTNKVNVISLYSELQSCDKVAEELKVSRKYVNRLLKESGVQLNDRRKTGVVQASETKLKISNTLQKRYENIEPKAKAKFEPKVKLPSVKRDVTLTCGFCKTAFIGRNPQSKYCSSECTGNAKRKTQNFPESEELSRLYWDEGMNFNEIGTMYSVTAKTVIKYFEDNGIPRRPKKASRSN